MVYGRLLFNNIKEYTPKWFPTIPYSQTVKPVFARQQQIVSRFNARPEVKRGWRILAAVFQQYTWAWQVFIFGLSFGMCYSLYVPILYLYQKNNENRTFAVAIAKEKAHKKKLRDLEKAEEEGAAKEE